MYLIKEKPEDFVVKEIRKLNVDETGKYSYYLIKKRNYTTLEAIQRIADKLNVNAKKIGFAGTKDKVAIAEQAISILNGPKKDLYLKDIKLKFLGKGKEQISLGDLEGNEFEIVIRNLIKKEIEDIKKTDKIKIPNYFGEQRFSRNNSEIGKNIVKKNFERAVSLVLEGKGSVEKNIKEYLEKNNKNFVGALKLIPPKLLRMYMHSYQSDIFNRAVEIYLNKKNINRLKNIRIPLVGFGTELKNDKIGKIIKNLMDEEKITFRDFIIREIPELSSEGTERGLFMSTEIKILEEGKDFVKIHFKLNKGSYATEVVKQLLIS